MCIVRQFLGKKNYPQGNDKKTREIRQVDSHQAGMAIMRRHEQGELGSSQCGHSCVDGIAADDATRAR
jgi:hypothetical protein